MYNTAQFQYFCEVFVSLLISVYVDLRICVALLCGFNFNKKWQIKISKFRNKYKLLHQVTFYYHTHTHMEWLFGCFVAPLLVACFDWLNCQLVMQFSLGD